jgi:putative endonuclease
VTQKRSRPKPRNAAERRARWWYRLRGYLILDTNRWIAGSELDLVARRGRTVVFCEVKSKSGTRFGDPLEMVTPTKIRRLRRAAEAWLAQHPELDGLEVRYDVLAQRGRGLEHVPDAF